MIVEITKIEGGLKWNNQERVFTTQYLTNSYQIERYDLAYIELNNQIFLLSSDDSKIDGLSFSDIQSEIAYIFNLS
jgi:hypothetical protein